MALLGYAGGGELGNFGHVGVDQATFGPAVFLWFVGIGGLTVAMAGGIARRPKVVAPDAQTHVWAEKCESLTKTSISTTTPEPEPESSRTSSPNSDAAFEPRARPERWNPPRTRGRAATRRGSRARARVRPPAPCLPISTTTCPIPEDLEYIDDDDATPGPIGDQRRPADD